MLSISRNLCELNSIKSEFIIEEEFKFNIHEKCVTRTVDLMEANVRNEKNRNLLKDSLSNYCNFIRTHLIELTGIEISELAAAMEIMTETDNLTIDQKWQKLLYRIVISIVRILRLEVNIWPENFLSKINYKFLFSLMKVVLKLNSLFISMSYY
jgi:hypothetical protein